MNVCLLPTRPELKSRTGRDDRVTDGDVIHTPLERCYSVFRAEAKRKLMYKKNVRIIRSK